MTGVITLINDGQNYVFFEVVCNKILNVYPSGKKGWRNTKILNKKFDVGDTLLIELQWDDYDLPLKYAIANIEYRELPGGEWLRENMSKEKKLYACPRGGDERMMYEVDCNGLPFYFECVNDAAVAASEALLNFQKIPEVLLEDVDGVMLFDEIKPGRPETIADIGHWFMVIYNNYIVDYGIITHEATHAWAYDKWGQYAPPDDADYTEVIRFSGEEPITEYAKTNYAEDLAEGVRYYVFDPVWMKNKCPLRYDIIERMMKEPGYRG
jgi:hypothetical protein